MQLQLHEDNASFSLCIGCALYFSIGTSDWDPGQWSHATISSQQQRSKHSRDGRLCPPWGEGEEGAEGTEK